MIMNSIGQHLYRLLTGIWSFHQQELDQRDERIADLELLISNQKYEIDQLKSQLDQYRSIFSVKRSFERYSHVDDDDDDASQRRSGVSAPPSILCTLIIWQKSAW